MAEPGKLPRDDSVAPPPPRPGGIAARARAAAGAPYLEDLNPEQRLAVETLDGPVLVLAGAGTGKTRVLTTRIAHILATAHARPGEILAVTFTNKAAREMKQRVGAMVGEIVEGMPWLGTCHSIGVKIIRRHAELVGLKPDFTIIDLVNAAPRSHHGAVCRRFVDQELRCGQLVDNRIALRRKGTPQSHIGSKDAVLVEIHYLQKISFANFSRSCRYFTLQQA